MARGVNRVTLVGNLGKDPEVNYTAGGKAIARISIATSKSWKDKQTGEEKEQTEWHNVVFFNRLAEVVGEFLKKGSQVYIDGSLHTNRYTDKNGIERFATEVIASEMQMLGKSNNKQDLPKYDDQDISNLTPPGSMSGFDQYDDENIPF